MKDTLKLLQLLNKEYPLPKGYRGSHSFTIKKGRLTLSVVLTMENALEPLIYTIYFEKKDLNKSVKETFEDIKAFIKEKIPERSI